jgi:DNA-binding MarR family transcriptional regulator
VSLSASSLKKRGFVSAETDQRDQRRTLLKLTESGREKYDSIIVVSLSRQERLLGCLPDDSRDLFLDCLDRLQREADKMLEEIEMRTRNRP